jgi:hypothetical protein
MSYFSTRLALSDSVFGWLNPLRFVLLIAFVGGIVALIWWAYATGHIKHVETVPPPVTAPTSSTAPMSQ